MREDREHETPPLRTPDAFEGIDAHRKEYLEKVKNVVRGAQNQLRELRILDVEQIAQKFKNKSVNESVMTKLPFLGDIQLTVTNGYYSIEKHSFTPDTDLVFISKDREEKPKKLLPHAGANPGTLVGSYGDYYAVALVYETHKGKESTPQLAQLGAHVVFTDKGNPLRFGTFNQEGKPVALSVHDFVAQSLNEWQNNPVEVKNLLPQEMLECPFEDNDTGNFTIMANGNGESLSATAGNFAEAKKEIQRLFNDLTSKRGIVHARGAIRLDELSWNVEPIFGSSYVSVEEPKKVS